MASSEARVQATYRRYWRCAVVEVYGNTHCVPDLPHNPNSYPCGWRWIAPILSDKDIEQMTTKPSLSDAVQRSFDRRSS